MIRILFLTSGLTHGGVNKSLLNLISMIDKQKYSFAIFPVYRLGPYNEFFRDYNVIPVDEILPALFQFKKTIRSDSTSEQLIYKLVDLYTKIAIHFFTKGFINRIGMILSKKDYDIVISFQEGFTTWLAAYIKAPKHIAWVHCDYSRYIKLTHRKESRIYGQFDKIVAVSEHTAKVFRETVPSVSKNVAVVHNVIDEENIRLQSKQSIIDRQFEDSPFILISIGRMDPVKRFSLIPTIASQLKARNIQFRWYIIGDGGVEKKKIKLEIIKNNVKNEVILLGVKNNPYPYIKSSSVLVCLSSSEACPNVVNEGRILHIPVVTTDYPSAIEFITSGENGFVASVKEIPNILENLYLNKKVYNDILLKIKDFNYDNISIMKEIEGLFAGSSLNCMG